MFSTTINFIFSQFAFRLSSRKFTDVRNLHVSDVPSVTGWTALNDDPSFSLVQCAWPGFYMLEFRIDFADSKAGGQAKLYIDHGQGMDEASAITVPFLRGRTVKRIIYFSTKPRRIRFDPVECAGEFSLRSFGLKPLLPGFAKNRMLKRILAGCQASEEELLFALKKSTDSHQISMDEAIYSSYQDLFSKPDSDVLYQQWLLKVEGVHIATMKRQYKEGTVNSAVKFSIIMPVYNPEPHLLECAIQSVLSQLYPHWELCIADDYSSDPRISELLADYASRDSRIKFVVRSSNGHISAASNSALTLASGEYIVLLDHDDELAEHALLLTAQSIVRQPSAKILYSDEDKIGENGLRFDPHFKSDWNPDLFFSQNYLSHLGVYQSDLVKQAGGFREGVEGAQDYDLCLRCLRQLSDPGLEIVHIPHILYHWRAADGSTAKAAGQKSYTTDAGITALRSYLADNKDGGSVEAGLLPNTYRIRYPLPALNQLVSILIPTRDGLDILRKCVGSILEKTIYPYYEILIINNQSEEKATLDYLSAIQSDSRVRVLDYNKPFNFSAINNFGVEYAKGDIIALVNNDVEVISSDWLGEMASHSCRPEIGCVGAKLHYSDGRIQHGGVVLGIGQVAGHAHKYFDRNAHGYFSRLKVVQNFSAVTAACLVVRRDVYQEVGGLNETDLEVAFNDVDFCLKVREAGYRNLWTPYAQLYHHESVSRGADEAPEKRRRFDWERDYMLTVWGEKLRSDPFYSPHLSLITEDFALGMKGYPQ